MNEQKFEQMKDYSALAFRFEPEGKDYFIVDSDTFIHLFECVNMFDKYSNFFIPAISDILNQLNKYGEKI